MPGGARWIGLAIASAKSGALVSETGSSLTFGKVEALKKTREHGALRMRCAYPDFGDL